MCLLRMDRFFLYSTSCSEPPYCCDCHYSWTQPGSAVDSYTVSYTYTIRRCGSGPVSDGVKISNGSARSVMLDNLEEDSDYSITLTANRGTIQLDSNVTMATTNTAGM